MAEDLSDMSEVSVEIDEEEETGHDERHGKRSRRQGGSSSEETGDDESSEDEGEDYNIDSQGRLSILRKMRQRMKKSDLFDTDDLQAIDEEMERIVEKEKNSLRAKMEERLRILTKYDKHLNMGNYHPILNEFFVHKQLEMQELAENAAEELE